MYMHLQIMPGCKFNIVTTYTKLPAGDTYTSIHTFFLLLRIVYINVYINNVPKLNGQNLRNYIKCEKTTWPFKLLKAGKSDRFNSE